MKRDLGIKITRKDQKSFKVLTSAKVWSLFCIYFDSGHIDIVLTLTYYVYSFYNLYKYNEKT